MYQTCIVSRNKKKKRKEKKDASSYNSFTLQVDQSAIVFDRAISKTVNQSFKTKRSWAYRLNLVKQSRQDKILNNINLFKLIIFNRTMYQCSQVMSTFTRFYILGLIHAFSQLLVIVVINFQILACTN